MSGTSASRRLPWCGRCLEPFSGEYRDHVRNCYDSGHADGRSGHEAVDAFKPEDTEYDRGYLQGLIIRDYNHDLSRQRQADEMRRKAAMAVVADPG